jgi:diacylglycerol diphosphate phosphatase/phosphatidate phosphatase
MVYALLIPLAIIAMWSFARFNPHKAHVTLLGFAISMLLTLFVTDVCTVGLCSCSDF